MALPKSIWFLLIALVVLNVIDFEMTKSFLVQAGSAGEANPMVRSLIESFGIDAVLIIKLFLLAAFMVLIYVKGAAGVVLYTSVAALDIIFASLVFYEIYWSPFRG